MLERELQDYLFNHPDVLLPEEVVLERSREFSIEGRRIDLLFRTEHTRYIVELKAVPLTREHVGQVIEYYGLMREQSKDCQFKMILVSPSIPGFRRAFLEEIGIRCIEMASVPGDSGNIGRVRAEAVVQKKRQEANEELEREYSIINGLRYDDLGTSVTRRSLSVSHQILRDTSPGIREGFTSYEVVPIRMTRADSPDRIFTAIPACLDSASFFVPGSAWWAYAYGNSESMPKNDVPNISAMAMPWAFDLAVNAELMLAPETLACSADVARRCDTCHDCRARRWLISCRERRA